MADQPYTSAEALTFRRYAMEKFHRPIVDLKHLGADTDTDFLRLALESVRDHLTHSFRTKRRDGTGFRVYPAYLDCISPNAFAGARDDVHLCGLNIGLAVMCFEFALFCLSQPMLLRDVGEADGEHAPKPVEGYPPGFWMRERGRALEENAFLNKTQSLIPSDPQRYGTAVFLSVLMIRFIWLHELAHCLNGHVGLVQSKGLALHLQENAEHQKIKLPAHHIRALERDADKSAFFMLLKFQLGGHENIQGLRGLPLFKRVALNLFSALSTIWLLDEVGRRTEGSQNQEDAHHPPPYHRLHTLIRSFASNIAPELPPSESHNAGSIMGQVFVEMTALSQLVPSYPAGGRLLDDMRDQKFQALLDRTQNELEALWPELDPHCFR